MEIVPLNGLSVLKFGDSKEFLISKFGQPTSIENKDGADGVGSEIYNYADLGLDVYLDFDANFVVWGISVRSDKFTLNGLSPIEMNETELTSSYKDLVVEVSDGRFKDYVNNELELLFFMRDGLVKRVDINPNLDNYIEVLSETEN
jgi:hypothetical protein